MEGLKITIFKFRNAVLMVREEQEENNAIYFENPATGKWHKNIEKSFEGWIEEQDDLEIEEWNMLKKFIEEDVTIKEKIASGEELIDYEELN